MENDLESLLTKAKELLKGELTQISYNTWIEPLEIDSIDGNNIILFLSDPFKKEQVDSRYHDLIVNTFNLILQRHCTLTIITGKSASINDVSVSNPQGVPNINNMNALNPKYSFSTFVVRR